MIERELKAMTSLKTPRRSAAARRRTGGSVQYIAQSGSGVGRGKKKKQL